MNLPQSWLERLANESPQQSISSRTSITSWLLEDTSNEKTVESRWQILRQNYLGQHRHKAYYNLMSRLLQIIFSCPQAPLLISPTPEQKSIAIAVVDRILKDLLDNDSYIQEKMIAIARCTQEISLRNALLLATLEDYCLQPLQNQILLIYLFNSYLQSLEFSTSSRMETTFGSGK